MCSWQTFEILHIFCNSPPLQIGSGLHKVSCLNSCWHVQRKSKMRNTVIATNAKSFNLLCSIHQVLQKVKVLTSFKHQSHSLLVHLVRIAWQSSECFGESLITAVTSNVECVNPVSWEWTFHQKGRKAYYAWWERNIATKFFVATPIICLIA